MGTKSESVYDILEVYNKSINKKEKPSRNSIMEEFPRNYDLNVWSCLKVKRLSDNIVFESRKTILDTGLILFIDFIKIENTQEYQCQITTATGVCNLKDAIFVNFLDY